MGSQKFKLCIIVLTALLFAWPALSQTKDEYVPDQAKSTLVKEKNGWYPYLSLGFNTAFSHTRAVVGATDGQTWNIGLLLEGRMHLYKTVHEWRNTLNLKEQVSRTPVIPKFVKTADEFVFDSIYLYHIPSVPWLGPFASFTVVTSLFKGRDERAEPVTYLINELDGTVVPYFRNSLGLTEAFAPTILKESIGMFAQPLVRDWLTIEIRLGIGANEIFVRKGLALSDDAVTPEIEVSRLQDFSQIGGELQVDLHGIYNKIITYSLATDFLMPFYKSISGGKTLVDAFTIGIEFKLGVKLASWASLDYVLSVKREPMIQDKWQVMNGLLLSVAFVIVEEPKPEPQPEEKVEEPKVEEPKEAPKEEL